MSFSLPHHITPGSIARAEIVQENFDAIYAHLNGGLDADSLGDRVVSSNNIGLKEVKAANMGDGAVTLSILDPALSVARLVPKTGFSNGIRAYNAYTAAQQFLSVPDGSFSINPSTKCVLIVTGMLSFNQVGSGNTNLYTALKVGGAGTPLVQGQTYVTQVPDMSDRPYNTIPICGFIEPPVGQTTAYQWMFKSSTDGAISMCAEGGRSMLNVTVQPIA